WSIRISTCAWSVTRPGRATCTSRVSPTELRQPSHTRETAMGYKNFTVETDGDSIALVTWDMPNRSINVIDMEVIEELGKVVDAVTNDAAIKGAVVTSAKDTFSGGADLTMLEGLNQVFADMVRAQGEEAAMAKLFEESRKLSLLYRRLETCGKPWVAALNGTPARAASAPRLAPHPP